MNQSSASLTDQDLLTQIRQHSEPAFAELHRRFAVQLVSAAFQRLHDKEIAEEVVQDLFVNLWIKREQVAIIGSVRAYLFTALRNRVIEQFRHQIRQTGIDARHVYSFTLNNTEESIFYSDLSNAYTNRIACLPPICRTVYELYQQGKLVADIAGILNIAPKTVESHLLKAKRTLRSDLRDYSLLTLITVLIKFF